MLEAEGRPQQVKHALEAAAAEGGCARALWRERAKFEPKRAATCHHAWATPTLARDEGIATARDTWAARDASTTHEAEERAPHRSMLWLCGVRKVGC